MIDFFTDVTFKRSYSIPVIMVITIRFIVVAVVEIKYD